MTVRSASLSILALLLPVACVAGEDLAPSPKHDASVDAPQPHSDSGGTGGRGAAGGATGDASPDAPGQGGSTGADASRSDGSPGGSTGAGGAGGASGGGGAAGGGGSAGGGGTVGSGGSGTGGSDGGSSANGFTVQYDVQNTGATSPYIECQFSAKNGGTTSVAVSELKIRYYFTDEVHKTPQLTINWSHISTSGANQTLNVTDTVGVLTPTATNADAYVEFSFSSDHSTLAPGESADFSWRMNGPNQATDVYTQTNDYSFDASKTALTNWDHVVLFDNGTVIWGVLP